MEAGDGSVKFMLVVFEKLNPQKDAMGQSLDVRVAPSPS